MVGSFCRALVRCRVLQCPPSSVSVLRCHVLSIHILISNGYSVPRPSPPERSWEENAFHVL